MIKIEITGIETGKKEQFFLNLNQQEYSELIKQDFTIYLQELIKDDLRKKAEKIRGCEKMRIIFP